MSVSLPFRRMNGSAPWAKLALKYTCSGPGVPNCTVGEALHVNVEPA